ncbi:MAG: MarC family protein [Dehalococcoidales bacterium]|nr:MarC family protein [Dehalococcoidales bacterium]
MSQFFKDLVLTFIPLFIVIDALGNIPIIITLSEGLSHQQRTRMINIGIATATAVGVVFLFFGQFILKAMGIPVGALTISGGIILLILSLRYILSGRSFDAEKEEMMAVVPIGTPLVVGPATITTLLLLVSQNYQLYIILIALALNLIISWVAFLISNRIAGFLGKGGLRAISQIFNLLLAAIAVNMMLRGLTLVGVIK